MIDLKSSVLLSLINQRTDLSVTLQQHSHYCIQSFVVNVEWFFKLKEICFEEKNNKFKKKEKLKVYFYGFILR